MPVVLTTDVSWSLLCCYAAVLVGTSSILFSIHEGVDVHGHHYALRERFSHLGRWRSCGSHALRPHNMLCACTRVFEFCIPAKLGGQLMVTSPSFSMTKFVSSASASAWRRAWDTSCDIVGAFRNHRGEGLSLDGNSGVRVAMHRAWLKPVTARSRGSLCQGFPHHGYATEPWRFLGDKRRGDGDRSVRVILGIGSHGTDVSAEDFSALR